MALGPRQLLTGASGIFFIDAAAGRAVFSVARGAFGRGARETASSVRYGRIHHGRGDEARVDAPTPRPVLRNCSFSLTACRVAS